MSKVRIKISLEAEGEDVSDDVLRTIELQCARLVEELEAVIVERVQPLHPEIRVRSSADGEPWE